MPKTEDVRSSHTKKVLRDTMCAQLKVHDFDTVTVNDICIAAAVSRTTFYMHYEDKYDLMVDCIRAMTFPAGGPGLEENPEKFFEQCLSAVKSNDAVIRRLLKVNDTMELKWKMDGMFLKGYTQYFQARYPTSRGGLTAEMLATYHCQGVMCLILWWFSKGFPLAVSNMAKLLADQINQV